MNLQHGESPYLFVNATGSPPLTYRILRNDVLLQEETSAYLTLQSVTAATHDGSYVVEVVSPYGTARSNTFTVTVAPAVPPSITLQTPTALETAAGGYLYLSASVAGSSPMTVQWFKDGVPLKEGTSSYFQLPNISIDHAGKYQLVVTNAGGTAQSAEIILTVPPPQPPEIVSYSSYNQTGYVGGSMTLSYSAINGSGPFTYTWYKDGEILPDQIWSGCSLPSLTANDAGTYWLEVSSPYGTALGDPIDLTVNAPWNEARPLARVYNNIVYLVAPNSALLRRYDLTTETWLPSVSLGFVPAGLAVNEHGLFTGQGRALQRFSHDITSPVNVRNFAENIREIIGGSDYLFVATASYVDPRIDSLDYTTFEIKGTYTQTYSLAQNLSLSSDGTAIVGRNMGITPSTVYRLPVNADGTFGSPTQGPYNLSYVDGTRFYFMSDGSAVIENNGMIFDPATMTIVNSIGTPFTDLVELSPERIIVTRGKKATVYQDGVPEAQHEFEQNPAFVMRNGPDLFAFASNSASGTVTVEKVAIAAINHLAPLMPVVAPANRAYRPAMIGCLDDFIYLYDRLAGNIHVFDVSAFAYTDSIPLRGRPSMVRLDQSTGTIFTAYSDGTVWRLDAASGLRETPFTILPAAPTVLVPAGAFVFTNDASNYSSTLLCLNSSTGARVATSNMYYSSGPDYMWIEARSRLYSVYSQSSLTALDVNADGTFGGGATSPFQNYNSVRYPLISNPGHGLLLTGAGTAFDAVTLVSAGAIGNSFTDGIWTNAVITTIRADAGGTQVQQWNPNNYTLTTTRTLAGQPLRIFARDNGTFVVVVQNNNIPVPVILDQTLNVVSSLMPLSIGEISHLPDRLTALGTTVTLDALPNGARSGATFTWRRDGNVLPGATSQLLELGTLAADEVGFYSVAVTFLGATLSSNSFWVGPEPQESYLINVSTRSYTEGGAKTLIMGFSLEGTGSKPLLMRTAGPALSPFGVNGVLPDPLLRVYRAQTELFANDNWQDPAEYLTVGMRSLALGAFSFGNLSKDAALLQSFTPGAYTIHADSSISSNGGVVLAEIYDAHSAQERFAAPRIVNMSGRTEVRTGDDVLILGFVVAGNTTKRLLIRGIGPTLGSQFGVPGALSDSMIEIYRGSTKIDENNNWGGTAALSEAFTQTSAFSLAPTSLDAAIIVTLDPGSYTAIVRGVNNATGIALAELYDLDR